VLGFVVLPDVAWWHVDAPVWLVVLQLAAILGVLSVAAWWLHRRRVAIRL
jgi:hypothetical protein